GRQHGGALELAVEHHVHLAVGDAGADEPVAHERQPVVADGLPPDPIAGLERHPPAASARTASDNSGHSRRASADHSSNGRSVRATSPTGPPAASGSTHVIVPAPPKWPYVAG